MRLMDFNLWDYWILIIRVVRISVVILNLLFWIECGGLEDWCELVVVLNFGV